MRRNVNLVAEDSAMETAAALLLQFADRAPSSDRAGLREIAAQLDTGSRREGHIGTVEREGREFFLAVAGKPDLRHPLQGFGANAVAFREAFGPPQAHDVGKRLYRRGGVLQMENDQQLAARKGN